MTDDREPFRTARDAGLKARHETRLARAQADWEGNPNRNCGDHRTTGGRAWCFDCSEWCNPDILCHGCIDFRTLLAPIDNALRNGSQMTKANLSFELLCEQLGIDRDALERP